eukprot:TRINITY_DN2707_c0_g1_i2.p1 TRINITY_DN2707_c0_g1~~TRINITY_DN2707_c0_g1_i2.p1  ORF type:complete len:458 (-),score=121.22 TRINITY_DN2707_c0_g1_i2:161-1534(-)
MCIRDRPGDTELRTQCVESELTVLDAQQSVAAEAVADLVVTRQPFELISDLHAKLHASRSHIFSDTQIARKALKRKRDIELRTVAARPVVPIFEAPAPAPQDKPTTMSALSQLQDQTPNMVVIEKAAQFCSEDFSEIEESLKERKRADPEFGFLFGGPGAKEFQSRLKELRDLKKDLIVFGIIPTIPLPAHVTLTPGIDLSGVELASDKDPWKQRNVNEVVARWLYFRQSRGSSKKDGAQPVLKLDAVSEVINTYTAKTANLNVAALAHLITGLKLKMLRRLASNTGTVCSSEEYVAKYGLNFELAFKGKKSNPNIVPTVTFLPSNPGGPANDLFSKHNGVLLPSRRHQAVMGLLESLNKVVNKGLSSGAEKQGFGSLDNLHQKLQRYKHKLTIHGQRMCALIVEWESQLRGRVPEEVCPEDEDCSIYLVSEVEIVGTFCEALLELRLITLDPKKKT